MQDSNCRQPGQNKDESLVAVDSPDDENDNCLPEAPGVPCQLSSRPITLHEVFREGLNNLERLTVAPVVMAKRIFSEGQTAQSPVGALFNDIFSSLEALARAPYGAVLAVLSDTQDKKIRAWTGQSGKTKSKKV